MSPNSTGKPTWALLSGNKLPLGQFTEHTLGCVVSDLENPTDDFFPPSNTEILRRAKISKVFEMNDTNAEHFQSTVNDADTRLKLTEIFSSRIANSTDTTTTIRSQTVITRILTAHPEIFKALKTMHDGELRMRLKENKATLYMIVGYKTCVDADISSYFKQIHNASADITIPVDKILAALGLPPTFGADLSASALLKKVKEHLSKHIAEGERIFAVQYRQITTKRTWLKKKIVLRRKYPALQGGLLGEDEDEEFGEEDIGDSPENQDVGNDRHETGEDDKEEGKAGKKDIDDSHETGEDDKEEEKAGRMIRKRRKLDIGDSHETRKDDKEEEEDDDEEEEDTTDLCLHEVQPEEFKELGVDSLQPNA